MERESGLPHGRVWRDLFVTYPPRTLLRDGKTDTKARRLFETGAVEIDACTDEELSATVFGRSGVYSVTLLRDGGQLRAGCDCPSHIYPCKHIGALAYAALEELGEKVDVTPRDSGDPDGAAGLSLDDERMRPGVELERSTVRGEAEGADGAEGAEESGAAIDSLMGLDPLPDRGIVVDADGAFHYPGGGPSGSERNKRYRPVFELLFTEPKDPFGRQFRSRLHVRAALIYIRKDGSDGALGAYGGGKPRFEAERSAERLYRYLTQQPGQAAPAVEALVGELGRKPEPLPSSAGEATGLEPIELYFEREPGTDPRRANPTPVERLEMQWFVADLEGDEPRLRPRFALQTGTPNGAQSEASQTEASQTEASQSGSEVLLPEYAGDLVDSEGGLLLIPVEEQGILFYLLADPPVVFALRRLIAEAPNLSMREAAAFARMCRNRLGEWVSVAEPPSEVTLLTVVPQPVVEIRSIPYRGTLATIRFRYGDAETGAETGPDDTLRLLQAADDSWNVFRRIRRIERRERDRAEMVFERAARDGGRSVRQAGQVFDVVLYRPAYDVLQATAGPLLDAGFEVRYHGTPVRALGASPSYRVVESKAGWFEAELGVHTNDGFLPLEHPPHRGSMLKHGSTVYVFSHSEDLDRYFARGTSFHFPADDIASAALIEEFAEDPRHAAFERLRTLRQRLTEFEKVEEMEPPEGLDCTLRPYQRHGLSWLWFLHQYGLGGCLADDMGLGKTLQALACLLTARRRDRMERALVVAPVTTLSNWNHEIERFAPEFTSCIHAGPGRAKQREQLAGYDIVLVSYATLRMDIDLFLSLPFDYLVLDEAQAVKNPSSKTRAALRRLEIPHRLALSGTPIENNTIELWSLFDLLNPGIFGRLTDFRGRYARPIEEHSDEEARQRLHRIVHPLLLRRRKRDVAPELPPREERVQYAEPEKSQRRVYESLRIEFKKSVEKRVSEVGIAGAQMHVLEAMLRLRQAAILPALVDPEYLSVPSAKLDVLQDLVATIVEEGNKALIFSQFVAVIDEVERRLEETPLVREEASLLRIDGSTPQQRRAEAIDAFQNSDGSALFLSA